MLYLEKMKYIVFYEALPGISLFLWYYPKPFQFKTLREYAAQMFTVTQRSNLFTIESQSV